jgi:hypothetical protein
MFDTVPGPALGGKLGAAKVAAVENYSPVTAAAAGVDAEPGVSGGYSTAVDVAARPLQFRQIGSSSVTRSTDEHRAVFGLDDVGLGDVRGRSEHV